MTTKKKDQAPTFRDFMSHPLVVVGAALLIAFAGYSFGQWLHAGN